MNGRLATLSIMAAAVVAGTVPASAADLEDPLSPLASTEGSMLCFGRDYSADHLAQHPKQTTKSVLLAFQEKGRLVTVVLTPRTGAQRQIPAGCAWQQGAGIDVSNRKIIPNFDKPAGFNCLVPVGNTDREGGYLLIDPARDGKSLTLFLDSPVSTADGKPGKAKPYSLTLDPEDRTFALALLEPKACEAFRR
jgi:glucose/arabinose dehydrogenase